MTAPTIENASAAQRDAASTFVVDVGFEAFDPDSEQGLTLQVEWSIGPSGPWSPATPQPTDRRHDPEGGLLRTRIRRALEGYWKLDGDGSDSSALGRDLTLFGAPSFGGGLFGQALALAGSDTQYARRPGDDPELAFDAGREFTVQAWVRFNSVGGDQVLVEKLDGTTGPGWSILKLASNQVRLQWGSGGPGLSIETPGVVASADAQFHHVVARVRAGIAELFWDGVSQATLDVSASPLPASSSPLLLGERGDAGQSFPLDGDLDEVAAWSRPLTDAEVGDLYASASGLELAPIPSASPGEPFNFVWNAFHDLPEGSHQDVHVRLTVSDPALEQDQVVVGPLTVSTLLASTDDETFTRSLQRRAVMSRTPDDFLGTGLVTPFRRAARDFASSSGVDLIRSSVRQILGTRAAHGRFAGELEWRPDFGSKLWILRQRQNNATLADQAAAFAREALRWEPRVEVTGVDVLRPPFAEPNELKVRVRYQVITSNVEDNLVLLPEFEETVTVGG